MNDATNGRTTDVAQGDRREAGAALSRRRFVKGAIATAPVLATLPSGAALARSSNIIGSTSPAGAIYKNKLLCLDARSGSGLTAGGSAVDLGQPPSGFATAITDRDYRVDDGESAAPVTEAAMCKNGGYYYYKSSWGWKKVTVPKGMYVSATAMSSFAGSIFVKEI
jgi:hypothetical protein